MLRPRLTLFSLTILAVLAAPPSVRGQVSNLDQTTFIEGLRKEGMSELLQHLSQTEIRGHPILSRQVAINQCLIDFAAKLSQAARQTNAGSARDLRRGAFADFHKAMDLRRALIKDFYDDDQRPLWQTDLAEQELIDDLQINQDNANDFYEFGVPSTQQRDAFDTLVPHALTQMSDADLRLSQEQIDLPRQPDHLAKRVNTGLWDRMNQYFNLRVPFFLANAAYDATLLPDSAPYYRNLGKEGMANQMPTPAKERARLLVLVIAKLDPLVKAPDDPYQVRRPAACLTARALIAQGNLDQAIAWLDPLIADGTEDRTNLLARLAKARVLMGHVSSSASLDVLAQTRALNWVRRSLLFSLLVADATHRTLLQQAQSASVTNRAAAIALAYEPYRQLLDDPALGAHAQPLQDFIARRWEAGVAPGQDMSDLPGMVVAALGELARSRGQTLMNETATQKDAATASQYLAKGKAELKLAISLNADLLQRTGLTPSVKAQAMFNEAVAIYYLNPRDPDGTTRCALLLTDLADQLPDQKLSEPGITNAVGLLHYLMRTSPRPPQTLQNYRRAVEVLMAKYPTTKAAMDERLYFAAQVLAPAGDISHAVEMLRLIPASHPDYFQAQSALLDCLERQYRQAQAAGNGEGLAAALEAEAARVDAEANAAQPNASGENVNAVRRAAGWACLVQADMAIERRQDTAQALTLLQNFDRDYAGDHELIREMLIRRIPALFKAGRRDDAYRDALRLMQDFPSSAGPVINQLLLDFDQDLEVMLRTTPRLAGGQKSVLPDRIQSAAGQELTLARFMVQWETQQKAANGNLLAVQLLYAKSLRLSGQPRQAVDILSPLLSANPDNAQVIFAAAEAWFALGGDKNLLDEAAPLEDRLISGISANNGVYPVMWWTAWMRRLQICDITRQGADQISLRVRQLRIKDANLGGDTTRPTLEMLEKKWGQ